MPRSTRFALRALAAAALSAIIAPSALAQATVPYTSPAWSDFGTTDIIGLTGNFMPGWTQLTGSPDVGDDLFFIPTDSLSGDPDDAALWLLKFDQTSPSFGANESAELSLSGFTPGLAYNLEFFATIVYNTYAFWTSPLDTLDIDLIGADISSWSSAPLADAIPDDDHNAWVPQNLSFTATASTVKFRFNSSPVNIDPLLVGRLGIDGLRIRDVPAPAPALALCAGGVVTASRRRRKS